VTDDGRVWGWGDNTSGQLGNGLTTCSGAACMTPESLAAVSAPFVAAAGGLHSVVSASDGEVWSWGGNTHGQLGTGDLVQHLTATATGFFLVDNAWLATDSDGDGLTNAQEYRRGTDPLDADTNGNGIPDGLEAASGRDPVNPDTDGDGVPDRVEAVLGTDPFQADTDGDGVSDGVDAFPLDPTRSQAPAGDPNDHTPPTITLAEPTTARRIR
jgi:hypothetical protein